MQARIYDVVEYSTMGMEGPTEEIAILCTLVCCT